MRRYVFAVGFAVAIAVSTTLSAFAGEHFLPLGGNITELRITNPSLDSTPVTIELLGNGEGRTTRSITLAAHETVALTDAIAELFGAPIESGALRVRSDVAIDVTANSRCAGCSAVAELPMLEHTLESGELPARTNRNDWRSQIVIVNPDGIASMVTLALERDGEIVAEKPVRVGARGTRILRVERFFPSIEEADAITFRAPDAVLLFGLDVHVRSGARVFHTPRTEAGQPRRRAVRFPSSIVVSVPQTITLTPSKDNSLFEESDNLSNGTGIHLFIGNNGRRDARRALIAFDVASQIPPGSRITRATLTMRVSQTISGNRPARLLRVEQDWGQGASNAGASNDGDGDSAEAGDATWEHTFHPDRFWTNPGGDFNATADATTDIGASGSFTWPSSAEMIARVQGWLDQPATNFGWIVIGDESTSATAKRFDSREHLTVANRPVLTVEFTR